MGFHQNSGRLMHGPMFGYLVHPDFAQKMLSFADFRQVANSVSLPAECFSYDSSQSNWITLSSSSKVLIR